MSDVDAEPLVVGVRRRQRVIAGSIWWTAATILLGIPALHLWVVPSPNVEAMADRLAYAARCDAVAIVPYFAVCMKIMLTRFLEGAHDPLSHTESSSLKIDCRVMQNHLEQSVAFVVATLALATLLPREHLALLPIVTGVFVVGRLVYWWGYHREGTLGRAPGVQLTTGVTIPLVVGAAVWVLWMTVG